MPIPAVLCRAFLVLLAAAAGAAATPAAPWLGGLAGALAGGACVVAERALRRVPARTVAALGGGLVIGWLATALAAVHLASFLPEPASAPAGALLLVAGAWLGLAGGLRAARALQAQPSEEDRAAGMPKLLDTSVIIDGRIVDVLRAGFVDGPILVPQFVLRELQQVADSGDALKRNRGRKGLDALKAMQAIDRVRVEITDADMPGVRDVDAKLLWLAERRGAHVLTNDYNLNKVAQLRGLTVLNLNDLANALKPVVLPGEVLTVQVIKEGKERNQGVGYLDDGTMVVVDNGRRLIGQRVDVVVSSVIQTNAGKMIFGAAEDDEERPKVVRRVSEAPHAQPSTVGVTHASTVGTS